VILYRGTIEASNTSRHYLGQYVTPVRNVALGYAWRTWLLWSSITRDGAASAKMVNEWYPRPVGWPIIETYECDSPRPDGSTLQHLYLLPSDPQVYKLLATEALRPPGWPHTVSGKHMLVQSLCPKVWSEECQLAIDTTGRVRILNEEVADITYLHCTCFEAAPPSAHLVAGKLHGPMTVQDVIASIRHGGQ